MTFFRVNRGVTEAAAARASFTDLTANSYSHVGTAVELLENFQARFIGAPVLTG
jgi:hypothetical protein